MAHWLYAVAAALLFFSLILLLFDPGNALLPHWVGAGLLTSTIGVLLLVSLQIAAELGRLLPGSGSWYQLLRLIGFSYRAALEPENGFVPSLLGFTFGVGLCEEITKSLPLLLRCAAPVRWTGGRPASGDWAAASASAWRKA